MGKIRNKPIISPLSFNLLDYSLFAKNKDNTLVYRCKYCFRSRIKKIKNMYFRLAGHKAKCIVLTKKYNSQGKNKQKFKNNQDNNSHETIIDKSKSENNEKDNMTNKNNISSLLNNFQNDSIKENENYILFRNFVIYKNKILGEGSFTKTLLGYDYEKEEDVAIKFSKLNYKISPLVVESSILQKLEKIKGFPKYKAMFKYNNLDFVIETLLGPDLKKIFDFYKQSFDISSICQIGIKVLIKLEALHKINILHNDLKLSNLAWGTINNGKIENKRDIFLLDFGLASTYNYINDDNCCKKKNSYFKKFYNNVEANNNIKGNLKFMSKQVLLGKNPNPQTELESFIYLIIYLLKNTLPWAGIKGKNYEDKKMKIIHCHQKIKNEILCKGLPYQIIFIYNDIIGLKKKEKPKYKYYQKILEDLLYLTEFKTEIAFCWEDKINEILNNNENSDIFNIFY